MSDWKVDSLNLDAMPADELMAFWAKHQQGRAFRDLGLSGTGAKITAANLAAYASNKATAMGCRLRGDIQTAQSYESICERIYSKLPATAKW